jgi:multiple sugar transport system permease protein
VILAAATALLWMWIFRSQVGLLNHLLAWAGLPKQSWLVSPLYAMPVIMWTGIWQSLGWSVVVFWRAAKRFRDVLRGRQDRRCRRRPAVSLHHLAAAGPTTLFVLVILIIGSLQVFGTVLIMTDGGPLNSTTVIVHQVYINAFQYLRMGYGSRAGIILFSSSCFWR